MTNFYICRHGETEGNRAKHLQGWIDTPLTADGKQETISAATKLENRQIDKIVSSDLGRAFETACIVARHIGYTNGIETSEALREINYGELANTSYDQFPDISPGSKAAYIFPGGESLELLQTRVLRGIDSISNKYPNKTVLIVGHDGTINSIRAVFTGEDVGKADEVSSPHDFVAEFSYSEGKVKDFKEIV